MMGNSTAKRTVPSSSTRVAWRAPARLPLFELPRNPGKRAVGTLRHLKSKGRGLHTPALLHALIHRSAWNRNSRKLAKNSSGIHRLLLACWRCATLGGADHPAPLL